MEAEATLRRAVVVAAGETVAPELELGSEFAYALDSQLGSDIALVELYDEHLAVVCPADAGSRHSESP